MKTLKTFIAEVNLLSAIAKADKIGLRVFGLGKRVNSKVPVKYTNKQIRDKDDNSLMNMGSLHALGDASDHNLGGVIGTLKITNKPHTIDKLKSGHEIHHHALIIPRDYSTGITNERTNVYKIVEPKTKRVSTVLTTFPNKYGVEHIGQIAAVDKKSVNHMKAADLYHHLITKHDKILISADQSIGGMNIWRALSKKKGVNIHGWDEMHDEPVNTPEVMDALNEPETHFSIQNSNERIRADKDMGKMPKKDIGDVMDLRWRDKIQNQQDEVDNQTAVGRMMLIAHKAD